MKMRLGFVAILIWACVQSFAAKGAMMPTLHDSLLVSIENSSLQSPTGIWWPQLVVSAKKPQKVNHENAARSSVVVWFHGGMGSGNCAKGFIAGTDFAKLYPGKIVVSVSACRENHWVTPTMMSTVDAALDSVAARRKSPVEKVSLVGVSDGSLGVLVYSLKGRRAVEDRLLMSSFGGFLGEPQAIASQKKMQSGRFRFLQGGKDRLYPSERTVPWITEFCKTVQVDCELRFDPEGEHDWSYWNGKHLDWIREALDHK